MYVFTWELELSTVVTQKNEQKTTAALSAVRSRLPAVSFEHHMENSDCDTVRQLVPRIQRRQLDHSLGHGTVSYHGSVGTGSCWLWQRFTSI
jgi:hypothetical protein